MNPRSGRARRAIEVYPHPATVALFGLGRTLKYKHKTGRDLDLLRAELLALMGFLEGLADADPPLDLGDGRRLELRRQVETATRKSELRVAEDQVDAVVCAYVALFAARRPEATTTYGDLETGYIVTPTLPPGLTPSPRPPKPAAIPVDPVREYALDHPARVAAGEQFLALVTGILDDAGINYLTVTGRTKTVASYAEKARRTKDGVPLYTDPQREITDTIGIRVITYVHSDVSAVADLLHDQVVVHDDRDMGRETAQEGRFGYASRHLLIGLDAAREGHASYELLRGRSAQVQVRTVLQHAWAEFEHDIRYKGTMPDEHARDFDRRFTLAAGLLELADQEFSTIRDTLRASLEPGRAGPRRRGPAHRPARAGGVPGRAVRRGRLVAHRPLRLDLRTAARARHHRPRRARRGAAQRRRGTDPRPDGLPLPTGCRTPARRRPARGVRLGVRRAERQRPPTRRPRGAAGEAQRS